MIWANGATVPKTNALAKLFKAVVEFDATPSNGSPEDVPWELADQRRIIDLLELNFARKTAQFSFEHAEELGSTSPYDWIRHNCRMTGQAVMDRISVGEHGEKLRESITAVEDGHVGFAHLAVISRTVSAVESSRMATAALKEAALLKRAKECSPGKLRYFCEKARHAADREAVASQELSNINQRTLEIEAGEYGVAFHGWLDSVGGAAFRSALEPLAQPSGAHDQRSRPKRLADALVELSVRALDCGNLPSHGGQRPHIQVTTTLEGLMGQMGAEGSDLQYSNDPISYKALQRLSCDSTISRVVVNAQSVVVDVGRATRTVSTAQRRALNSRDGGCQWPGCDRSASWSAAHHLKHWTKDRGPTDLDNLVLLCHRHHTMVHEGCWQLVPTENGFRAIPPTLNYFGYLPSSRAPDETSAA